mmetsp:Transcript_19322/g.30696  ORF Transcript_19322/g.30696 Transcript_19322/m.30696 type:complete len:207 (-) Transcript_19322:123-743(-)
MLAFLLKAYIPRCLTVLLVRSNNSSSSSGKRAGHLFSFRSLNSVSGEMYLGYLLMSSSCVLTCTLNVFGSSCNRAHVTWKCLVSICSASPRSIFIIRLSFFATSIAVCMVRVNGDANICVMFSDRSLSPNSAACLKPLFDKGGSNTLGALRYHFGLTWSSRSPCLARNTIPLPITFFSVLASLSCAAGRSTNGILFTTNIFELCLE